MNPRLTSTTRKAKPSKISTADKVLIKMSKTCVGCDEKVYAEEFEKGKTYSIGKALANVFIDQMKVARKTRQFRTPEKSVEIEVPEETIEIETPEGD